jgi:hypothetical protein
MEIEPGCNNRAFFAQNGHPQTGSSHLGGLFGINFAVNQQVRPVFKNLLISTELGTPTSCEKWGN